MVALTTTTATYKRYAMGATTRRPIERGGIAMGINVRIRYAISWTLIRTVMTPVTWLAAAIVLLNTGITLFAFWFSPELKQTEAIRLLKSLDKD